MRAKAKLTSSTNEEVRAFLNKTGQLELNDRLVFTLGGLQFSRPLQAQTQEDDAITVTDDRGQTYTFEVLEQAGG